MSWDQDGFVIDPMALTSPESGLSANHPLSDIQPIKVGNVR